LSNLKTILEKILDFEFSNFAPLPPTLFRGGGGYISGKIVGSIFKKYSYFHHMSSILDILNLKSQRIFFPRLYIEHKTKSDID
jgi:hypothetical protein